MAGLAHPILSRFAAAAVALALSGVPQLVEHQEHAAGHRCHCPARGAAHDCDCPVCHAESARRGRAAADDASLPPCHRAMAAKVARATAEAGEAAQRRSDTSHCLTSSCSAPAASLLPPPATERFVTPEQPALATLAPAGEVTTALSSPPSILREPETPPPRAARAVAALG